MRNLLHVFTITIVLLITGCYHLRLEPEPLPTETILTSKSNDAAIRIIKRILENELQVRIIDEMDHGRTLISSARHFATDTGFGQPVGGRQYYMQLQIEIERKENLCHIYLTPYHYELRTSYAYGLDGQIKTLHKVYPYPEYPGMFELSYLNKELKRIASMLENALKEFQ